MDSRIQETIFAKKSNCMNRPVLVYAVDLNPMGGEGILGATFLRMLGREHTIKRCWFRGGQNNQDSGQNIFTKYVLPILYALEIRLFSLFFRDREYCYVNYLPLWNTLIYLILPKSTILGPTTGGKTAKIFYKNQPFQRNIRHYLFPILYAASSRLIENKFPRVLLGTDFLCRYFRVGFPVFANFNFCVTFSADHDACDHAVKKDIDFLFYLRDHPSKYYRETIDLICLLRKRYAVRVVGDVAPVLQDVSLGYQSRTNLVSLIRRSKFTVSLSTNSYSLFFVESVSMNVPSIYFNPEEKDERSVFLSMSVQRICVEEFDRVYSTAVDFDQLAYQVVRIKNRTEGYFAIL